MGRQNLSWLNFDIAVKSRLTLFRTLLLTHILFLSIFLANFILDIFRIKQPISSNFFGSGWCHLLANWPVMYMTILFVRLVAIYDEM